MGNGERFCVAGSTAAEKAGAAKAADDNRNEYAGAHGYGRRIVSRDTVGRERDGR